jgi:hypothetical protein
VLPSASAGTGEPGRKGVGGRPAGERSRAEFYHVPGIFAEPLRRRLGDGDLDLDLLDKRAPRESPPARETLELSPLPCWKHLTPEKRQQLAAAMVSEIDGEAADRRERTGVQPLGPAAILAQSPESRPLKTKRSPAPAVHAASQTVRRELRNAYFLFVAAYRSAAEKLRAGQRDPPFPTGSFPPPLPFVGG